MCGAAAAEILADATGQPVQAVGRLRAQAPLKPLPFGMLVPPADAP
jgi:hydrogen cyanide synthase HcnB